MDSIYRQGGKIQYAGKYLADEEIEEAIEWISSKSNDNDLLIIIDDKSISTAVGIIAATCAKRSIMILESRLARKSLLGISREYKPKLIIGRDNELKANNYEDSSKIGKWLHVVEQDNDYKKGRLSTEYGPLVLVSTSGSSSKNKFVILTQENLIHNCNSICQYLKTNENTVSINNLPLSYSYGLSVLNTTMRSGGTFIVSEQPSHLRQQFWDDMNTYRVTDFSGVPSTYNEIVEREFMDLFPESIVNLTQAGGKLDIEMQNVLLNRCKVTDINLYIMYGQTEASARLTYLKLTEDQGKIGSVGKVIPGVSVDMNKLNGANEGELVFTGENISLGYSTSFDDLISLKDMNKGVLKSGDIGRIDEHGYIYITGRISRFCKINGTRYSLDVIESEAKTVNRELIALSDDNSIFILSPKEEDEEVERKAKTAIKKITGIQKRNIIFKWNTEIILTSNGKPAYGQMGNNLQ